jgi:hypothetical protein
MSRGFSSIDHHVAFGCYREMMWSQNRDMIFRAKEFLMAIIWNPSGFYVVYRLPNHAKMNKTYFMTNLLISLEQTIFPRGRAPHERRLLVPFDNCFVHTVQVSMDWLEEHSILRVPRQPYSSDLVINDFYLFSIVKEKLERIQVADENQFLDACKRF